MDWLSRIDPNIVLPILIGGATWLWGKIRGKKETDARSIIDAIIETLAHEVLDQYSNQEVTAYLKTARAYVDARIWSVLAKRGIPKNALTIRIINEALERQSAWLASQILAIRNSKSTTLSTVLK